MRCSLYSSDGPLMSEGTCEMSEGSIRMVAERWHMTPQPAGPPLALTLEDGHRFEVAVAEVHVTESDAAKGPTEVYRLVPLEDADDQGSGGILARVRALFHRGAG